MFHVTECVALRVNVRESKNQENTAGRVRFAYRRIEEKEVVGYYDGGVVYLYLMKYPIHNESVQVGGDRSYRSRLGEAENQGSILL